MITLKQLFCLPETFPGNAKMAAPDEAAYSSMFDASINRLQQKNDDFKLTQEEEKKFRTAFSDPEFRSKLSRLPSSLAACPYPIAAGMMTEYMEEISDPKHRAETEQYITQVLSALAGALALPDVFASSARGRR